jgi:hypothetical protein
MLVQEVDGQGDIGGSLLIGEAENVRVAACQLGRTRGVWESRVRVEGRAARRHRTIEAIVVEGERVGGRW